MRLRLLPYALPILISGLLGGCGGSSSSSGFVTGITVSSASVVAGTDVTITATVKDATMLKSATWSADGGTLSVPTGLTTHWVAPSTINVPSDFSITLLVRQTSGLSSVQTIKIHVSPSTSTTGSSQITGLTVSNPTPIPGELVTATVTVANTTNVVKVLWTSDVGTFVSNTGFTVQWRAPQNVPGGQVANLTATVQNSTGGLDTATAQVTVLGIGSGTTTGTVSGIPGPTITILSATPPVVSSNGSAALDVEVATPANVASYSWSAQNGTLTSTIGNKVTWVAPQVTVQTVFVITATVVDKDGGTTVQSLSIKVLP